MSISQPHEDDPVDQVVRRLLEAEEAVLGQRRRQLLDLRHAVERLESGQRHGFLPSAAGMPLWEEVTLAQEATVLGRLVASVPGPVLRIRAAVPGPLEPAQPDGKRHQRDAAGAHEHRVVLPLSALADGSPGEDERAAGGLRRYLPEVPLELTVLGREVALLHPPPGTSEHLVLVRAPVLVEALAALSEALWQQARPAYDGPADASLTRLLELLALGLKDEAIGRALGLSVRTVRRRVATAMAEAGVDTRFQLGLAVARRGALGDLDVGGVDRVGRSVVSW